MTRFRLFTLGYSRHTPESLVAVLEQHRIGMVLDVRANASSLRPEFASAELERTLRARRIGYAHRSQAGNPFRGNRGQDATRAALEKYEAYLSAGGLQHPGIQAAGRVILTGLRASHPWDTALLCACADPAFCHRSILANHLLPHLRPSGAWSLVHIPSPPPRQALPKPQLSLFGGAP